MKIESTQMILLDWLNPLLKYDASLVKALTPLRLRWKISRDFSFFSIKFCVDAVSRNKNTKPFIFILFSVKVVALG
jgi:hypothetical protein